MKDKYDVRLLNDFQRTRHFVLLPVLRNRNFFTDPVPNFDKLRFRFRLLTSYGSGSVFRP